MPFENRIEVLILDHHSHLIDHVKQEATQHAAESIET